MSLPVRFLCGSLVLLLSGCSCEESKTPDGAAGAGGGQGGVSRSGNGGHGDQDGEANGGTDTNPGPDEAGGADARGGSGEAGGAGGISPDSPATGSGGIPAGGEGGQPPTVGSAGTGTSDSCQVDADCPEVDTIPERCAEARCEAETGTCSYLAVDADGDGFRLRRCQTATAGVVVDAGEDCNDGDPDVNPAGWDGPGSSELEDGCNDGLDNDCSGSVDDGQLENGSTCTCTPGETMPCSMTPSGLAIEYPALDDDGHPLGNCSLGSLTCNTQGNWAECTGAQGPVRETCDGNDNDCDGIPSLEDEDVVDPLSWSYDVDNDGYRLLGTAVVIGCEVPADVPSECLSQCTDCETECPASGWQGQLAARPDGDCNDNAAAIHPGVSELCNGIDDDCDGTTDPGCDCIVGEADRDCGLANPDLNGIGECHFGSQKCVDGHWSTSCVGAQDKIAEQCGGLDHDCDNVPGNEDENATNKVRWVCDADGDDYALSTGAVEVLSCTIPATGTGSSCEGSNPQWLEDPDPSWLADCDDGDAGFAPNVYEACDGEDEDCDGTIDNNGAETRCEITGNIATAACEEASCVVGTCTAPYLNCNEEIFDCETNGATDSDHCGTCTTQCYQRCVGSSCDEFVEIAGGDSHTCARTAQGRVRCWGLNSLGQLGDTTVTTERRLPTPTVTVSGAVALSVGHSTSCAISTTTAWCWGWNEFDQLGNNTADPHHSSTPVTVNSLTNPTAIGVGVAHACAAHNGGRAACWGNNMSGQLGRGNTSSAATPITVLGLDDESELTNVIAIVAGELHSCAIVGSSPTATQGQVVCWGDNTYSQLGDNVADHNNACAGDCALSPVMVTGPFGATVPEPLADAVQLSAGQYHTCAVRDGGQVVCWGRNQFGQLGDGSLTDRGAFVNTTGVDGATEVKARGNHTCAVDGGSIACWGHATYDQLGDGESHETCGAEECSRTAVTLTVPAGAFSAVGVGGQHSCAVQTSGQAFCWGRGANGRLGSGTTDDHPTPYPVSRQPDP